MCWPFGLDQEGLGLPRLGYCKIEIENKHTAPHGTVVPLPTKNTTKKTQSLFSLDL